MSAALPGLAVTPRSEAFRATDLEVDLPDGRHLLSQQRFSIEHGDPLLITGPSGSGKSTLFRVLAGIWPFARGRLSVPSSKVMFLPQRPYVPLGTLRHATTYPKASDEVSDELLCDALRSVGLDALVAQLDLTRNWSQQLSGGEQQRLALARALVNAPDWLFMDEPFSALDQTIGASLFALLRRRLPATQIVLITHDAAMASHAGRCLTVSQDANGTGHIDISANTPVPSDASVL